MNKFTVGIFCLIVALWGYKQEFPLVIVLAETLFSIFCTFSDLRKGYKNISFITFYSFFTLFYCIGNFVTIATIEGPDEYKYNLYLYKPGIDMAVLILLIGNISVVYGFEWYRQRKPFNKILGSRDLYFRADNTIVKYLFIILGVYYFMAFFLDTELTAKLKLLPLPGIFFLTRHAVTTNSNFKLNMVLIFVLLHSVHGLMYGYLRAEIIDAPIIFFAAYYLGKPDIKNFLKLKLVPLYIILVVFIPIFVFLGEIRDESSGVSKLDLVITKLLTKDEPLEERIITALDPDDYSIKGSFLSRISNINQVSQLIRVVNEDGFYDGSTLEYFSFAFIPRFLWPNKPVIAQGKWFALRIGQAYINDLGSANNSVNMTTPGELYLNFGYSGVVIGMFLIGILISFFWKTTQFWESSNNLTGTFYALFLLSLAMTSMGADTQFLVTQISYFVLIQVADRILNLYFREKL